MVYVIPCTFSKSYYELILILYNFEEKYYTTCSGGATLFMYSILISMNDMYRDNELLELLRSKGHNSIENYSTETNLYSHNTSTYHISIENVN